MGFSTKWCQNWIRSPVCIPKLVSWNIFCRGTTWYNSPFPYCPLRWCHNIISLWFTLPFQQACDRPWWSKSSSFIICRYLSYMLFIIFCWIPCQPYSSFFILFHPPYELGGWGWSHPFSSGPGICSLQNDLTQSTKWAAWKFLYKVPGLG